MDPVLLLTVLFITGLVVEAMTGAITAGEMRMDLFGVLVVANVTAFGGGVVRDLILSRSPMLFVAKPELIFYTSAAAIIMVLVSRYFGRLRWIFISLDALGLITFTIVGAMRGLDDGHGFAVASIAGVVTGVFGGVLRDILCNRIPLAFHKELYAAVSIGTVWLFLLFEHFELSRSSSVPVVLGVGFVVRILAVKYDWRMPLFVYEADHKE